jgi:hypothetical protein
MLWIETTSPIKGPATTAYMFCECGRYPRPNTIGHISISYRENPHYPSLIRGFLTLNGSKNYLNLFK